MLNTQFVYYLMQFVFFSRYLYLIIFGVGCTLVHVDNLSVIDNLLVDTAES